MENSVEKCENCKHWRDKAWNGDEGTGVCDNLELHKQVSISNPFQSELPNNPLRFSNTFSCKFYEEIK